MTRIALFIGLAIALFVGCAVSEAIESVQHGETLTFASFAFDLVESAMMALAVTATAFVTLEIKDLRRERALLIADLARARHEGEGWRDTARVHVDGLSKAIAEQFDRWGLSEGEREVATFTLKGLSHKDIAGLRGTNEATVRQQAAAVYRKSGLSSRAELSAYFLEDLLSPSRDRAPPSPTRIALVERRQ